MQLLLLEPGDEDKGGDKVERDQHKDKGIAQRPCDSEAFSRPEGAETGKHNANDKFERVLWHLLEWGAHERPQGDHEYTGDHGPDGSGTDAAGLRAHVRDGAAAEGNDDERDLKSLQQNCLVRERHTEGLHARRDHLSSRSQFGHALLENGLFIVYCLEAAIAQNRLFEPLQTKEDQ